MSSPIPVPIADLPWTDAADSDSFRLVAQHLKRPDPVIIEAGVCGAEDTLQFHQWWPEALIYGFEPHPITFGYASENVANSKQNGIKLYPYALGQVNRKREFNISARVPAASSLYTDNLKNVIFPDDTPDEAKTYEDTVIRVQGKTLDSWAKEEHVTRADFFWLDAEGAELEILRGGQELLKTTKVVRIEMSHQEFRVNGVLFDDIYRFLIEQQFELATLWGNPKWQSNGIFVRQ